MKFPTMPESDIMKMEDKIYKTICGNGVSAELAAWLAIFHSHFLRLNNRVNELESQAGRTS